MTAGTRLQVTSLESNRMRRVHLANRLSLAGSLDSGCAGPTYSRTRYMAFDLLRGLIEYSMLLVCELLLLEAEQLLKCKAAPADPFLRDPR